MVNALCSTRGLLVFQRVTLSSSGCRVAFSFTTGHLYVHLLVDADLTAMTQRAAAVLDARESSVHLQAGEHCSKSRVLLDHSSSPPSEERPGLLFWRMSAPI